MVPVMTNALRFAAPFAALLASTSMPAVAQTYPWGGPATAPRATPAPAPAPSSTPAPAAATPASFPAPVAAVPVAPPVAIPPLNPAQEVLLVDWLDKGVDHGVTNGSAEQPTGEALVAAVLDRARALRIGRLEQAEFLEVWAMRPANYDPRASFAKAVTADRVRQWIADQTPPYSGYDGLKKGLVAYRVIAAAGGWPTLAAGDISSGSGPRVAALRTRLRVEDPAVATTGGYDEELREAVRRAQRRYGLNPTGNVGAQTLAALNVPVQRRIDSIVANMERWRWLPRELPKHRVQVNIAAAILTVFEGDKPVQSMRAVTGAPSSATPMLESRIHSIVVNPPWNVPMGIAKRELFPKGAAYLAANNFKVIETPEGGRRLQQAAGPSSALGRLKFDFANPFAVYLHDTPAQAGFGRYDRLASHGCVRLEKPLALAQLMLKTDPKWQGDAVAQAIAAGPTKRVQLPEQVAVYLLYWTAYSNANGTMNFRDDPYGWDKVLASKVAAAGQRAASRQTNARVQLGMN